MGTPGLRFRLLEIRDERADLKSKGSEIDEESMRETRYLQIVENLRIMFFRQVSHGFQFQKQPVVHNEVSEIVADYIAVGIVYLQVFLRLNFVSGFFQAVAQTILVYLLQITVAEVHMYLVGNPPNLVQQLLHLFFSTFSLFLHGYYSLSLFYPLHSLSTFLFFYTVNILSLLPTPLSFYISLFLHG